jgi:hypothetical protein
MLKKTIILPISCARSIRFKQRVCLQILFICFSVKNSIFYCLSSNGASIRSKLIELNRILNEPKLKARF